MKGLNVKKRPVGFRIAAVFGLILFGVVSRTIALDEQGLWHDELYTIAHLSGFDAYLFPSSDLDAFEPPRRAAYWLDQLEKDRYWATLDRNLVHEGHPPLYQLGLKGWTSLFGRSFESIRSFSLLPALLTIPIFYLLGLRFRGPKVGITATLLIAVSPFHLYYSVEARNYTWSLLFSTLALLAIVALWQNRELQDRRWLIVWWIAVVGACYAHYYSGLYCLVLMIFLVGLRRRSLGSVVKLGLPFLLFVPWLPVLLEQINLHSEEHWTAGAPGVFEAATGFVRVLLDQLTGVFHSASLAERIVAGIALLAGIFLVVRDPLNENDDYDERWLFLSVPAYGLVVLAVDVTTNHHTILVARYLISILPSVILICAWLATGRAVHKFLLILLVVGNLVGVVATVSGTRAPKQMLREAGAYIGKRYSKNDLVLVTPSGPTFLGLTYYLPHEAKIAAAPPDQAVQAAQRLASTGGTVWLVRQDLGTAYELPHEAISELSHKPIRFAGITVFPIRGARQP